MNKHNVALTDILFGALTSTLIGGWLLHAIGAFILGILGAAGGYIFSRYIRQYIEDFIQRIKEKRNKA